MADLDTVKVILRSLVMSTKRSMSTYDLQRDFRQNEGYECPFVALGYRTFASFLESIPDTVRVLPGGTVVAVATEETQHIARLVALQRDSSKKPRRGGYSSSNRYGQRPSSYSRPSSFSRAPRFQQSNSSYNSYRAPSSYASRSYETPSSSYGSGGRASYTVGAVSKTDRSYQATDRSSYAYEAASRSRSKERNDPPPFSSAEKFFEAAREAKLKKRAEELLSNPPPESRTTSSVTRTPTPTEAGWSGEAFITDWRKQHAENAVEDSQPSHRVNYAPERYSSDEDSEDSFYERFKEEDNHDDASKFKPACETVTTKPYFQSSDAISDPLKNNLKNLIKSYPEGLWACVLPEKYKETYGVNLQWKELGYDSIVQMFHDLPDIVVCKRVQGGDWMLYDASSPLSVANDVENSEHTAQEVCILTETVKCKIFDVVKKYTSGIRADQLAELYHEHYSRSLAHDAPGFDSTESLLTSLDGTIIRLRYIRQECYVLPGAPPLKTVAEPAVEVSDDIKELGFFPGEVMGPKESFSPPQLPPDLKPGDYLEVRVAEVYNPFKLWVMLREKSVLLDKLMDELQDFYKDHGDKYFMPDSTITVQQCCAAIYDSEWHRATITSVGKTIQVFYVDYGTVASVSKKELRFLHSDFSVLPVQAIQASLSGIQPVNGRQTFTMEANRALLDLVADKHLIGLVQKIELQKPFLELFLIDTTGDTDIHLNDVLVNLNHAMFKPEILLTDTNECVEEEKQPKPKPEETVIPIKKPQSPAQPVSTSSVQQLKQSEASQLPQQTQQMQQPQQPPPGFVATGQAQMPPVLNSTGTSPFYNVNNLMFNQTLPGFSSAYSPQMNAAVLLQQQQQQQAQAYLLAYYQSLYQQSLLNLQRVAVPAGNPTNNPWLGPFGLNASAYYPSGPATSPANTYVSQSTSEAPSNVFSLNKSGVELAEKRDEGEGKSTPSRSLSSFSGERLVEKINTPSKHSEGRKSFRLTPMSNNSSSSSISDLVVEHLDEYESDTLSSSSSPFYGAPDLVQSVGNMSIVQDSPCITNYWKAEEVCHQCVHIFNVDEKAFVSMGELARKFTRFSTSDSLLRVLKNKGISPELKKITRQDKLYLFSSLDGCSDEFPKSLDLSRNKSGNVVGTFYLCPLVNVPTVLIPLGTDVSVINGFRALRDKFDPNDNYWRN
ncbi:tudor domain-containing protein 5 isoform X2 [Thrips palmi]|uniref:Tudor domain-containing protein 5 isoform X2 n=1 Tax=Thrips palmi TaxID=161013 RepID=A0A6P8YBY7_THRPL|nr:tudor domain-containing protein 5 isoform X2 [Thrips palmi]